MALAPRGTLATLGHDWVRGSQHEKDSTVMTVGIARQMYQSIHVTITIRITIRMRMRISINNLNYFSEFNKMEIIIIIIEYYGARGVA